MTDYRTNMIEGRYTDRHGNRYEISKISRSHGVWGYMTFDNPKTGHGWGGEICEVTWCLDVSQHGIVPAGT